VQHFGPHSSITANVTAAPSATPSRTDAAVTARVKIGDGVVMGGGRNSLQRRTQDRVFGHARDRKAQRVTWQDRYPPGPVERCGKRLERDTL